ncbi:hypothetical protein [Alcaligenes faecalis]|uniref:DUF7673 domain-containing protein n=1 Tax=Alcaligenes faecalis TaxID=511 RepID=A0ABY7N778_ALCFA|nr:hypothetical protein [Alcaligenes faecalis]WBM39990.1 hypothetical protein M2J83_09320 [Alcaligenes faecalis]
MTEMKRQKNVETSVVPAVQRLLQIAKQDGGQGERVARFLLSWYNAKAWGGFDLSNLFSLEASIKDDILNAIQFMLANPGIYPDDKVFGDDAFYDIEDIKKFWGRGALLDDETRMLVY